VNATSSRESIAQRKSLFRRSLRLCTADGLVAMPIVTMSLPVNVFLAALFTKCLHLPKGAIGVIASLPFRLQLPAGFYLAVSGAPPVDQGAGLLSGDGPHGVLGGARGLLSYIPTDDPAAAGRWLGIWFFVSSFAAALAGVGWNSWIQEWVPARLRGKYFGQRNRLLSLSTVTFLVLTGWALEHWSYSLPVFQVIILCAVFLRIFSLKWIWQTPAGHPHSRDQTSVLPVRKQLELIKASSSLVAFIGFGAVWSFAANAYGAFYHVFMFEQLSMSAFTVGMLSTLAALGGALSLPAWGQLLDRFGNKAVMTLSLILWQLGNVVWCFLEPGNRNLLFPLWVWGGMTSAGFILGQFTLLLKLIPVAAKNLAIGVYLAVTSIVAAVAPILGGQSLDWALARTSDPLSVYHLCFILQPALAITGAIWLLRVQEPSASSLTSVVGAMRNIRTLSGIFRAQLPRQLRVLPSPAPLSDSTARRKLRDSPEAGLAFAAKCRTFNAAGGLWPEEPVPFTPLPDEENHHADSDHRRRWLRLVFRLPRLPRTTSQRDRAARTAAAAQATASEREAEAQRKARAEAEAHRLAALKAEQDAEAASQELSRLRAAQANAEAARAAAEAAAREAAANRERLTREKELAVGEARRLAELREKEAIEAERARAAALNKLKDAERSSREQADREAARLAALKHQARAGTGGRASPPDPRHSPSRLQAAPALLPDHRNAKRAAFPRKTPPFAPKHEPNQAPPP
jgi:MFS family permease